MNGNTFHKYLALCVCVCVFDGGGLNKSQDFVVCKNVKRSVMNENCCINDLPSLFPQVWGG